MGYDLPASIGVCIAHGKKELVCVTGDGSIQMNLQELQTIITNKLPIKIFVINNQGYHSIRQTQSNFFGEPLVGIGPDSGDLEFPDMGKIAYAYGFPYKKCISNSGLKDFIVETFKGNGPVIAEVFVSKTQMFEPKSASMRMDDGSMVSAPLEDLAPFLSRDEFLRNMIIDPISS
jgi:acetolactate synthase-1/2/3 large subunit